MSERHEKSIARDEEYKGFTLSVYKTPPPPWHTGAWCCTCINRQGAVATGFNEEHQNKNEAVRLVKQRIDQLESPR